MTRLTPVDPGRVAMPPLAPLPMPDQDLARPFRDPAAPPPVPDRAARRWRAFVFLGAVAAIGQLGL